jgi:hypothetical protein
MIFVEKSRRYCVVGEMQDVVVVQREKREAVVPIHQDSARASS